MKIKKIILCIAFLTAISSTSEAKPKNYPYPFTEKSKNISQVQSSQYQWMDDLIKKELAPFENGISLEQIESISQLTSQPIQRFKIISNKVLGPEGKMKNLLTLLCSFFTLPDVDFIYFLHDGFIVDPNTQCINPPIMTGPIFTSAKDERVKHAILFADWYFDPTSFESSTFDWSLVSQLINKHIQRTAWAKKKSCAVWRGGFQGYMHDYSPEGFRKTPRGKACLLSIENPQYIDAGTNWHAENSVVGNLLSQGIDPRRTFLTHKQMMHYKYIIDIDGHTCTYPGLQWKMLSNSTVIKQETSNKMWFFSNMVPWVHYVPVKEDLSDLLEKVIWCTQNDSKAKAIANNGRNLALETMMPEHCLIYCYKTLSYYAKLQKFTPTP